MPVSDERRLMCVHAHPDDESSKGAATMAKYVRDGVDVLVVTLTDGSRGSVLNPALDTPETLARITEIRAGEPWQPLKLYYSFTFHKARLVALHEALLARGIESPYAEWLEQWVDKPGDADRVTTRVECGEYFPLRDDALRAHATQVDPDGR